MHTTQPLNNEQGVDAPVMLNASFEIKERGADLRIWGAPAPGVIVTVIHEIVDDALISDFALVSGIGTEKIIAADQESITILARFEGHILACGVYEVSLRQAEMRGVLLVPCVEQGLMLRQEHEEDRVALGVDNLLAGPSLVDDFDMVAEVAR